MPGGNPLVAGMCISLPLHDGEHLINLDLDEEQQKDYLLDEVKVQVQVKVKVKLDNLHVTLRDHKSTCHTEQQVN